MPWCPLRSINPYPLDMYVKAPILIANFGTLTLDQIRWNRVHRDRSNPRTCARWRWSPGSWSGWSGPCSSASSWRPRRAPVHLQHSRSAVFGAPGACGPQSSGESLHFQTLSENNTWQCQIRQYDKYFVLFSSTSLLWHYQKTPPSLILKYCIYDAVCIYGDLRMRRNPNLYSTQNNNRAEICCAASVV